MRRPSNLDATPMVQGSDAEQAEFARALVAILKQDGYVILQNHGIPDSVIAEMLAWNKKFFDLSKEVKRTSTIHTGGQDPVRGFKDVGYETAGKLHPGNKHVKDPKDAFESFNVGPLKATKYPNRWVDEDKLPSFRSRIEECYTIFRKTATHVLEMIELGLEVPKGTMTSLLQDEYSEIRMNHYPPVSVDDISDKSTSRIWPHTDIGSLTMLIQDSEGGLEFEDRGVPGTYVPVLSNNQSDLIINVADILQRWTNGVLEAGLHRVTVPKQFQNLTNRDHMLPARYSIAFFQRPGEDQSAGPVSQFVTEDRPAQYDEITALGYLQRRNKLIY